MEEVLQLDMGTIHNVGCIRIFWGNIYPQKIRIAVSADGISYVSEDYCYDGDGVLFCLPQPTECRYIRVMASEPSFRDPRGYEIYQIKAYTPEDPQMLETVLEEERMLDIVTEYCLREALGHCDDSAPVDAYLENMQPDGSWNLPDKENPFYIEYYDPENDKIGTDWINLYPHLYRVRDMLYACAYDTESKYYKDVHMLEAVDKGLEFWFENLKPHHANWWQNELGIPQVLRRIGLMGQHFLKEKNLEYIIGKNISETAGGLLSYVEERHTGANKVWFCENTICKGLLTRDVSKVMRGVRAILSTIYTCDPTLPAGEGLQADGSFTQHSILMYSNGYGRVYYTLVTEWAYYFRDTQLEFPKEKLEIVANAFLEGNRWMMRYETVEPHSMGREFIRVGRETDLSALPYRRTLEQLKCLVPEKAEDFRKMIDFIDRKRNDPGIVGNKMFYITDYMAHHREAYYLSVKMQSDGVKGTEDTNYENVLGGFMSMGSTFLLRSGCEYVDEREESHKRYVYPVWDWSLIPGVTAPRFECITSAGMFMNTKFAGGTTDGEYGVAGFDICKHYGRNSGAGEDMDFLARKAYFLFDREIVALGAGITCDGSCFVETTLNQSLLHTNVRADGKTIRSTAGSVAGRRDGQGDLVDDGISLVARWVWQDEIGYVFPESTEITVKNGQQTGNWRRFTSDQALPDAEVTDDIFSLRINHGRKPKDTSYCYVLLPAVSEMETQKYSVSFEEHIQIISNTKKLQAVRQRELGVTGAVFYEPGRMEIDGDIWSVDRQCILLIKKVGGQWLVSISNAADPGICIKLKYERKGSKGKEVSIRLPAEPGYFGKTVTVKLEG